jgi:hypothetical protein
MSLSVEDDNWLQRFNYARLNLVQTGIGRCVETGQISSQTYEIPERSFVSRLTMLHLMTARVCLCRLLSQKSKNNGVIL